ncbi:hypothetical protein Ciccas_000942 [Cichlidogyrus casuarinus]|uniref:C2 domain-containing protein n=1 Tax=Cichlidogyrus casuarinus TaxID=1844966 RepID=A0ABD2QLY2_9PLAT
MFTYALGLGVLVLKIAMETDPNETQAACLDSDLLDVTKTCCEIRFAEYYEKSIDNLDRNNWVITVPILLKKPSKDLSITLHESFVIGRSRIASFNFDLLDDLEDCSNEKSGVKVQQANGFSLSLEYYFEPLPRLTETCMEVSTIENHPAHGVLYVKVLNSVNLRHWDFKERPLNAFCILDLNGHKFGATKAVETTGNAKWNEEFETFVYFSRKVKWYLC